MFIDRAKALILIAVGAILFTAACTAVTPPGDDMNDNPYVQFSELMKRPDIDTVTRRYKEMDGKTRDRLSALGVGPWRADQPKSLDNGCRNFLKVDNQDVRSGGLPLWSAAGGIPDDKWPAAYRALSEVVRVYGFDGRLQVVVDQPGNHEVVATDAFGGEVTLGTQLNAVFTVRIGCHLTAAAHKRGKPAGGP